MKFTCSVVTALFLIATWTAHSFTYTTKTNLNLDSRAGLVSETLLFLTPDDLTNYMATAHEEKIRAIKEIEEKKNDEIKVSTFFVFNFLKRIGNLVRVPTF